MNTKKFSEAMSEIDSKYVDEAIQYQSKKKTQSWLKWAAMAACLCLIVVTAITVPTLFKPQDDLAGGDPNNLSIILFPDDVRTVEVIYSIYSSDTSRELSQDEIVAVKEWATALELQQKTFNEGEKPNQVYAGGISYRFNVNNGEISFCYSSIDEDYIVINDEWYLVLNPSFPPIETN